MSKEVFGSIAHRNDTAENWARAINFSPKKGEIIIYNPDPIGTDYTEEVIIEGVTYTVNSSTHVRFKIGDGITNVNALPFVSTPANEGVSAPTITVDSKLSGTSTNPVQNKVVKAALDDKANANDVYNKETLDNKLSGKENTDNRTDSIDDNVSDTNYTSVKAVKDYVRETLNSATDSLQDSIEGKLDASALGLELAIKIDDDTYRYFKVMEITDPEVPVPSNI